MARYNAAVLGCGAIFTRHLAALQANAAEFEFVGFYDPLPEVVAHWSAELPAQKVYGFEDEVYEDQQVNCVIILSPSHLHFKQAKLALEHQQHVILEKPVSFNPAQVLELEQVAQANGVQIYSVLQVRLNPSIEIMQKVLAAGLLGDIRSSSLVQRWQRPADYFSGWRGTYAGCGGVLYEFGIHYLDIMLFLLGVPTAKAASFYNTKFKTSEVSDSVYALLDFGTFGGTLEISLVAEPRNIEVSLVIIGSAGFVKLGGKSLDQIVAAEFLTPAAKEHYDAICVEALGKTIDSKVTIGACPHHPELYKQILLDPQRFALPITYNVINLIDQINRLEVRAN